MEVKTKVCARKAEKKNNGMNSLEPYLQWMSTRGLTTT